MFGKSKYPAWLDERPKGLRNYKDWMGNITSTGIPIPAIQFKRKESKMIPVAIAMNGEVHVYEITKEDKSKLDNASSQIWEYRKAKKMIKEKYKPLIQTEGFYK